MNLHKKGFSFGYKNDNSFIKILNNPGPGDYNITQNLPISKNLFENRSNQNLFINQNHLPQILKKSSPGPGSYSPKEISSNLYIPFISKSNRTLYNHLKYNDDPGPGIYNIRKSITFKKKIRSLQNTISKKKKEITPGPGQYLTNDYLMDKLEKSRKNSNKKILNNQRKKNDLLFPKNTNPGPGNYEIYNTVKGPYYSMRISRKKLNYDSFPGPGSYDTEQNKIKTSLMKKDNNPLLFYNKKKMVQNDNFPGPGNYNISRSILNLNKIKIPGQMYSKTERIKKSSFDLGPGSYNVSFNLKKEEKKGFCLSNLIKNPNKNSNKNEKSIISPKKQIKIYNSKQNFKFQRSYSIQSPFIGKSERNLEFLGLNRKSLKSPGPAGYSANPIKSNSSIIFLSSQRDFKLFIPNNYPGVGSYNIPNCFDYKNKKFKKNKLNKINNNLLKMAIIK